MVRLVCIMGACASPGITQSVIWERLSLGCTAANRVSSWPKFARSRKTDLAAS